VFTGLKLTIVYYRRAIACACAGVTQTLHRNESRKVNLQAVIVIEKKIVLQLLTYVCSIDLL